MYLFAGEFVKTTGKKNTGELQVKCLISDDTTIEKTGKLIEKASYVWDYDQNRCVMGFKLLVMGYWDDISFYTPWF